MNGCFLFPFALSLSKGGAGFLKFSLPIAFILIAGCAPIRSRSSMLIRTQVLMGTVPVTITVLERPAPDAVEAAFEECRRLERVWSRWIPESDIARANHEAGSHPVTISQGTVELIREAIRISEISDGAFDITYLSTEGSYRDIDLKAGPRVVRFKRAGLKIDADGIAKGMMVDRMIAVLQRHGVDDAMVNAGGDLRAIGRGPDGAWTVKIQDPRRPRGKAVRDLEIADQAVASAGFYERGAHIFSPATRRPIKWQGLSGVTVVARDTATANALATAVWVKGPAAGKLLADRLAGQGIIVYLIP